MTIVYFFIVFSILVLVHEFGHFLSAKKQGIAVEEFGFGFPPRLFSYTWHGTRYSLNLLPLGGFVRIKGEEGENAQDPDSFSSRPIWQRGIVIAAGVVMNVALGWFLLTTGFIAGAPSVVDDTVSPQYVRDRMLIIRTILPHAPATTADIRVNDIVLKAGDTSVIRVQELQDTLKDRGGKETILTLKRGEEILTRSIVPQYINEAKRIGIGIGLDEVGIVRYPFFTALGKGFTATGFLLRDILLGFWNLVRDLVVQQRVTVDLTGPIGIATLTGQVARRGIAHIVQFTALLSLNLAVLNALPIPALDGGRLFFLLIEKVRKKSVRKETESLIHRISFVLLILLVILVTYKDITKLLHPL